VSNSESIVSMSLEHIYTLLDAEIVTTTMKLYCLFFVRVTLTTRIVQINPI
jgi:hypothetical protein